MNEALAWAQWWFSPWSQAHEEWDELSQCIGLDDLWRAQHSRASVALNIAPCLPLPPQGAVLQLALASAEQLQQMLALLGHICHRPVDGAVSDAQHLWCLRLSKAITLEALLPGDADPLHLLQAWVEPAVWQRLRLRFPPSVCDGWNTNSLHSKTHVDDWIRSGKHWSGESYHPMTKIFRAHKTRHEHAMPTQD
ncbi:type III secretion protein [Pseudomonas pergaminensis]|uniref:type III secretion protein n=1 Tax=Pseudomonas pergaminensis TaxID=2853159 RepID=UPI0034D70442